MGPPRVTPRIVLDTNTLVSALLVREGRLGWLRRAWQAGHLTPLACRATLTELMRVLAYPKFRLGREEIEELLADFVPYAETAPNPDVSLAGLRCRDPDDQVFLALAIVAGADALVTGDRDLLDLAPTAPVPILTPAGLRQRLGPS